MGVVVFSDHGCLAVINPTAKVDGIKISCWMREEIVLGNFAQR
jgi:hypothetical protein